MSKKQCLKSKYPNIKCPSAAAGQLFTGELSFLAQRKYYSKRFFWFFRISGQTGSGKLDASILGESLDQEEPNNTSSLRIGSANLSIHTWHYSYLLKIKDNKSILGNIQNYAFLRITAERTTTTIIPPPSKNFSHWPSQKSNTSESSSPNLCVMGSTHPYPL